MSELDALYRSWHGEAMSKEQWIKFMSWCKPEELNERIMHLVAERDALRARIAELEGLLTEAADGTAQDWKEWLRRVCEAVKK